MFDSFRCVPPGSQRGNSNVAQWELSRKTISELMGESDIEADHYMQRGQASCRRGWSEQYCGRREPHVVHWPNQSCEDQPV